MQKEIKYNGYTARPSDYECPDGDLGMSLGMVPEYGSLHPVMPPKALATWQNVNRVFVHENNFTHYIVVQDGDGSQLTFKWCDDAFGDLSEAFLTLTGETVTDMTAIGNMLMVASSVQMYYVLWKDGAYKLLGNSIPDVSIIFALDGKTVSHKFANNGITSTTGSHQMPYKIANTSDNFTAVMAIMNSFVNQYSVNENRFIYPFFVRYALRLFDGSYLHISDPVLMVPNSGYVPWMHLPADASDNLEIDAYAVTAALQMRLLTAVPDGWEDIIAGADIFVSQPVYPYAQGEAFNSLADNFTYKLRYTSSGASVTNKDATEVNELEATDFGNIRLYSKLLSFSSNDYKHQDLYPFLAQLGSFGTASESPDVIVQIAPRTTQEIRDDIENTANFYLVHSLKFDELLTADTAFKDVALKKGALRNLVDRKALADEMLANRTLLTGNLYAYNNRLHAFNASFRLAPPGGMLRHNQYLSTSGPTYDSEGNIATMPAGNTRCYHVFVFINTDQGNKVVHLKDESNLAYCFGMGGLSWFFYPDNRAYRALFVSYDRKAYREVDLTPHAFLNGAYWLDDSLDNTFEANELDDGTYTLPTGDDSLAAPSNVYVSEPGNPFAFLAVSTVAVGANEVLALATSAKPLSTGQFGQFPLYAFTDNGVWALETSSTGSYVARQPITRDVCVNVDSICQLESSVLFATDRGVMELAGSNANCITDNIKTNYPFDFTALPEFDSLVGLANNGIDTANEKELAKEDVKVLPFRTFLAKCRIVNDYANQRIILFNPGVRYAYVLSRESSAWGMVQSDNRLNVNAYPQAQVVDTDGNLLDYGQTSADFVSALLVTRPFAMGEPDFHKTVYAIIQRGFFRKGRTSQALYGSNDMFNWFLVASSADEYLRGMAGTPYKYFRLVLFGKVRADESVYGCTVQYERKLTDQPR